VHNVASPEMLYCSSTSGEHFEKRAKELKRFDDVIEGIVANTTPSADSAACGFFMKTSVTIAVIVGALLLGGCAGTTRIVTDTATGGLGAFVGSKIGHGSPVGSVVGAGAGVLLGEAFTYANDAKAKTAYGDGFEKGRSDAVKQQYWLMVNQQRPGGGI